MRWCASALALLVAGVASAQEIGGAWFIERGRSQPIAMLTVGRIDDLSVCAGLTSMSRRSLDRWMGFALAGL